MDGRTYAGRDYVINSSYLNYCNVDLIWKMASNYHMSETDRVDIYETYSRYQGIEILANMGLKHIVRMLVVRKGVMGELSKKKKKPYDVLQIYPQRVKYLCQKEGDYNIWKILRFERNNNLHLTYEQIEELTSSGWYDTEVITELMQYMSFTKAWNRINEYYRKLDSDRRYSFAGIALTYRDYLNIRNELGYDMSNSVYLHPRNLIEAHDEMVAERRKRQDDRYIAEMLKKYNKIPKKYKSLVKKYGWTNSIFVFSPAKDAADIIREGRLQHHCVGGHNYLSKHNDGTSAIIFMRYKDRPSEPYVTIEVSKDRILQWYCAHDKKTNDQDTLCTLNTWEKLINRRINKSKTKEAIAIAV